MKLSDIVQNDYDRVFIVDYECFLIYTGHTISDDQPFIRIGNWEDLPPEIIPLIESIILTEQQTGNPLLEQINTDSINIDLNRYVGNNLVFNTHKEQQALFAFDLSSCQFTDIGPDTPEIDTNKIDTSDNQILGIFTRKGIFKVLYKGTVLFELTALLNQGYSYSAVFDTIVEITKAAHVNQSGFSSINGNPLFFSQNQTIMTTFPDHFADYLILLNLNPAKVHSIIHEDNLFTPLIPFTTWAQSKTIKISIYSNNNHITKYCQNHTNNNIIKFHKAKNIHIKDLDDLIVKQYNNSKNYKVIYKGIGDNNSRITMSYIKENEELKNILNDTIDFIIIKYSVFEQCNLLFKSSSIPILIMDDHNPNLTKLSHASSHILFNIFTYQIMAVDSIDQIIELTGLNEKQIDLVLSLNEAASDDLIDQQIAQPLQKQLQIYNILNLIKTIESRTTDRTRAVLLNQLCYKIESELDITILQKYSAEIVIKLVYFDKTICTIMQKKYDQLKRLKPDMLHHYNQIKERITNDRQRLKDFIRLYMQENDNNNTYINKVTQLKKTIHKKIEADPDDNIINEKENSLQTKIRNVYSTKIKALYTRITTR